MHVWSDGENYRISMVGGIAYCQIYDCPGLSDGRKALLLSEMAASARRMLDRGLRPLGLVIDLRRASRIEAESGKLALGAMLARWQKAQLPAGVLVRDESTQLSSFLQATEASKVRVFTSLVKAEYWMRARGHDAWASW